MTALAFEELAEESGDAVDDAPRFIDDVEIMQLPRPDYLVEGILVEQSLATLYGQPAAGKSFLALDLALCIASGLPFFGNQVKQGAVVYVASEGLAMMGARVDAWKHSHEQSGRLGVYFWPDTVLIGERAVGDVPAFIAAIERLGQPVRLIVLDTLAHALAGSDENSALDMGIAMLALRTIQRRTGATVLPVHHMGKNASGERGSSALRGAMDTMIELKKEARYVTVTCSKQKDGAEFAPFPLELVPVADSCAFIAPSTSSGANMPMPGSLPHRALRALHEGALEDGLAATAWMKASGMPDSTFWKIRTSLVAGGYVERIGKGRGRYIVTPKGADLLASNSNVALR